MSKKLFPIRICLLFLLLAFTVTPAIAQRSIGVVAGISARPAQFYFGGNVMAGRVAKDFWFRPSMEVGFGHSTTLVTLNGEFVYNIELTKSPWNAYLGGGPALIIATFHPKAPASNSTDSGPGFNFLAGIRRSKGAFAEIKVGAMDSPEFKLGIGYSF